MDWKKRNEKGFTLVELVVVIAILGILVALAVPRLFGARENAAKNAHNSNVRMIESAVALYEAQYGDTPGSLGVLATSGVDLLDNTNIYVPDGVVDNSDNNIGGQPYSLSGGNVSPGAVD